SVMQPLYGYLSDRVRSRWFTVLAPFIAGLFISSLGLARGYAGLLALVLLGGVGIAAFHPQGAAHASTTLRERRGLAMAIFISSGSIGLSCGPMLFALVTGTLGLARSYWAALPGLACTLLLAAVLPEPPRHERGKAKHFDLAPFQAVWKPMTLLYFLVIIRSVIQIAFTQFLALYFHSERGFSVSRASLMLTLFLFGGSMGGFLGGNLADRLGGKRIVMFSMIGSAPLLALFMATGGAVSLAALFLGGLILLFTTPVNVTMAQDLVPSQAGTVSALMMGFAWGMAGLVIIPLFGWAADHVGLGAAMRAIVLLPLAGFVLAVLLPEDRPALERAAAR
ncbi:MAG TPA: MFS transporter, partial [Bryobacterales bacterium]|nr:MFS transporter [Bryobacterales bacterium]